MGVTPKFKQSDVQAYIQKRVNSINKAIENRLIKIGEEFVRNARENGAYNDITGNLRSSVGYVVLKNGVPIQKNIRKTGKGSDKQGGVNKANQFVNNTIARYGHGWVLIGFAGMEYAASVESRGKDVITSSAIIAEKSLKIAIKTIDKKIAAL